MMRIPRRDVIATCLVATAVVLYVLWLLDAALPGIDSTRTTGLVILGLGFAASATAVVPAFDQLLHGNKAYLTGVSLLGLIALVAGVVMLWSAGNTSLTVLMAVMGVLWIVATIHHTTMARANPSGFRSGSEAASTQKSAHRETDQKEGTAELPASSARGQTT